MRPSAFQTRKGVLVPDSAGGLYLAFQIRHEIGLVWCNSSHVGTRGNQLVKPIRISNACGSPESCDPNLLSFRFRDFKSDMLTNRSKDLCSLFKRGHTDSASPTVAIC
jgi:hypothetical protein